MAKQVFYDPKQARWKRIRRVFDAAALAFSFLLIFFIYSAMRSDPLPDLSWLIEKRPYHPLIENEKTKAREKRRLATVARAGHRHQTHKAPSQLTLNSEQGVRAAFYCCSGTTRQLFYLARVCAPGRLALSLMASGARPGWPSASVRYGNEWSL